MCGSPYSIVWGTSSRDVVSRLRDSVCRCCLLLQDIQPVGSSLQCWKLHPFYESTGRHIPSKCSRYKNPSWNFVRTRDYMPRHGTYTRWGNKTLGSKGTIFLDLTQHTCYWVEEKWTEPFLWENNIEKEP